MTALLQVLFRHASDRSFLPYLDVQEYNSYGQEAEKAKASFQQLLTPDQQKLLEELEQAEDCCTSIELEAAFQAGLAIGLELSRL